MIQQFNNSTIQQFKKLTIQQFNNSTIQRFNNSTIQHLNNSTIQLYPRLEQTNDYKTKSAGHCQFRYLTMSGNKVSDPGGGFSRSYSEKLKTNVNFN